MGIRPASEPMRSKLIHASTGVPPQVESMRPMGTCSRELDFAAEEIGRTAEKSAAVCGVHSVQVVPIVIHRKVRSLVLDAQQAQVGQLCLSDFLLSVLEDGVAREAFERISMLDWPEAIQDVAHQNVRECDGRAGSGTALGGQCVWAARVPPGVSQRLHLPRSSALAVLVWS